VAELKCPARFGLEDLPLVFVGLPLPGSLPENRAADAPIGLDVGAEHVVLDRVGIDERAPHIIFGSFDHHGRFGYQTVFHNYPT